MIENATVEILNSRNINVISRLIFAELIEKLTVLISKQIGCAVLVQK